MKKIILISSGVVLSSLSALAVKIICDKDFPNIDFKDFGVIDKPDNK